MEAQEHEAPSQAPGSRRPKLNFSQVVPAREGRCGRLGDSEVQRGNNNERNCHLDFDHVGPARPCKGYELGYEEDHAKKVVEDVPF
jgi:hypothetical protein